MIATIIIIIIIIVVATTISQLWAFLYTTATGRDMQLAQRDRLLVGTQAKSKSNNNNNKCQVSYH